MIASVALPVRNGGSRLGDVLSAIRGQELPDGVSLEIVVCDSGSTDGSAELAERAGAELVRIPARDFSHGETRNLLMGHTRGEHVAFLTQDAVPAGSHWLASLLQGFAAAERVGLVYGPYRARPQASPMVRRELDTWFASLSPDGQPRVDRLSSDELERGLPPRALYGPRGFFTDANGAVARAAWLQAPFRAVPYAEDHALAQDLLRRGWAKVFVPGAAVVHSHDYGLRAWLRRAFDEARAVSFVYENADQVGRLGALIGQVRGGVAADVRAGGAIAVIPRSLAHHGARAIGTGLGARAASLPPGVRRRLSLERRG